MHSLSHTASSRAKSALTALLLGCAALASAAEPPAPAQPPPASQCRAKEDANRELLHRYHVEVWEQGKLERAGAYVGPGFKSHARPGTMPPGAKAGPDLLARFRGAFPDLTSHEDALLADGDLVVIRWTLRGTQTKDFFGIAPTGRHIEVSGMDMLRVENGRFVEHWGGFADQMDKIIAQLTGPASK